MAPSGRSRCGCSAWLALAAISATLGAEAGESSGPVSLLDTAHPGRLEALRSYERGAEALRSGDLATARESIEAAVRSDPLHLPSWIALAALRIESCDRAGARGAALVAMRLAPGDETAREAGRRAASLDCGESDGRGPARGAEEALADRSGDYRAWAEAAASRRERGDGLVAALFEEQALELGGEPAIRRMKLAADLERAGLLRSAQVAWLAQGGPDALAQAARLGERIAELEPAAAAIGSGLAQETEWSDPEARQGLEDLALCALAVDPGADRDTVRSRLEVLLGVPPATVSRGAWGRVTLRTGWVVAEAPAERGEPPSLLLRRFPGDTGIALLDPRAAWADRRAWQQSVQARLHAAGSAEPAGPPEACPTTPEGVRCEVQPWRLDGGGEGVSLVLVHRLAAVRPEGGTGREIWAVGWVGDAGCGRECEADARRALADQVAAIEPPTDPAPELAVSPRPFAWPIPPPASGGRRASEREDPWRRVSVGEGLVVEVPPGLVVARVGPRFRDVSVGPDTALWIRGSFEDQDGVVVTVGGPGWAGWIDVRRVSEAAERAPPVPRTDPGARIRASADLAPARNAAGLGGQASTTRLEGAAFDGTWILHRVRLDDLLVEIALPLAAGARSLAPLWMAVTARRGEAAAPPPPFDLARRYRLRIERMSVSRSPADPRDGILLSDELQFIVPRGYRASLNAESADGFPVTLRDDAGSQIVARRWPPPGGVEAARRDLEGRWGAPLDGWTEVRSRRGGTVERASFPGDEEGRSARAAALLAPARPEREPAFLLEFVAGSESDAAAWAAASQLVTGSLKPR